MEDELAFTIDRYQQGAPLGVEAAVHPRSGMRADLVKHRRPQIERQHAPAHEVAIDITIAGIFDTEVTAHQTAWSIGADQIFRMNLPLGPAVNGFYLRHHAVDRLFDSNHTRGKGQL